MDDTYPHQPGAMGLTPDTLATSTDAADAMGQCASHLRMVALRALAPLDQATVLECVAITDYPRESLQPRYSELIRFGMAEPTGQRRRNPSGKSAAGLRLTDKGLARREGGGDWLVPWAP